MPNYLWHLPLERRKALLHITLLALASLQEFTANGRLLALNLTSSLNLPLLFFQTDEVRLAQGLAQMALEISWDENDQKPEDNKNTRKWKISQIGTGGSGKLGTALSSVGIGASQGGLGVSPAAAAALLGPIADNGRMSGSIFGFNQPRSTSRIMDTFAKEITDFAIIPLFGDFTTEYRDVRQISAVDRRLRLIITMSGWLTSMEDVTKPWMCLGNQAECYAVRWEIGVLESLGTSLETIVKSSAWTSAKKDFSTISGEYTTFQEDERIC
jgi:hypothetical protein